MRNQIQYGKILRPSENDFKDFRKYVEKIFVDPKLKNQGCVKVL